MPTTRTLPGVSELMQEFEQARLARDALLADSPNPTLFLKLACRAAGTSLQRLTELDKQLREAPPEQSRVVAALVTRLARDRIGKPHYGYPVIDASDLQRRIFPQGQADQFRDAAAALGTRLGELYCLAAFRLSRDEPQRFGKITDLSEHEAAVARQGRKIAELRGALEAAKARLREELAGVESALGQIAAMGI